MSIITTHSLAAVPSARRNVFYVFAKIRRAINLWVAAYLAFQERRAAAWASAMMSERELRNDFDRSYRTCPTQRRGRLEQGCRRMAARPNPTNHSTIFKEK